MASESRPLLTENDITVNGKPTRSEDDFEIMRQRPNKTILGRRLFLSAHNTGAKLGDNLVGRWLQNIGETPVFYDSIQQVKSAQQLGLHYFNLGYYRAQITHYPEHKGRKTKAHYEVWTGPQFTLATYEMYSTSRYIDSALQHLPSTLELGAPIVAENIEAEQLAITNFLKNNGYHKAALDWSTFEVDTTGGPNKTLVRLVVDPYVFGGDDSRKHIASITVNPTFSYAGKVTPSDTAMTTHGLRVIQNERKYRPEFIDKQIFLERGQTYSQRAIQSSYKNLSSMGTFSNVEMNIIEKDSALEVRINMVPLAKRSIATGIEGTGNSGNLGVGGNFTWTNRNLFGGGEHLKLSTSAIISEQRNSTNSSWLIDAREINAGTTLDIPQLVLPKGWLPLKSREWQPHTRINAQASYQFRANEFNRTLFSTALEYQWKIGKANHQLAPWKLSFVQLDFTSSTSNDAFLFVGFQNIVFPSTSYNFTDTWTVGKLRHYLGLELESGGHLWNAAGLNTIAQNPVSAYTRTSVDYRWFRDLLHHRIFAGRTYIGLAQTWNSTSGFVPFEKSFFMGGSNDLRGWTAYHFGPGAVPEDLLQSAGFFTAAPIKFVQSLEWRFTIQDAMKGALFFDAGNMWLYHRDYTGSFTQTQLDAIALGTFKWNSFYRQLGLNAGYGLRYDVEFFILRADIALKIHHPGAVGRSNWTITNPTLSDLNLSFGIGYPF